MDAETGTIVKMSNGPQDRGIYEVNGVQYVFCKNGEQFCFCTHRYEYDIHEAWRHGYKEEIARAKAKDLETVSA